MTRPHPRLVEVTDVAVVSVLMKLLAACGVKEPIQKRCSTKDKQSRSESFSHAHHPHHSARDCGPGRLQRNRGRRLAIFCHAFVCCRLGAVNQSELALAWPLAARFPNLLKRNRRESFDACHTSVEQEKTIAAAFGAADLPISCCKNLESALGAVTLS